MKRFPLLIISFFALFNFNTVALANKIAITETPVVLEKQGDNYALPNSYKMSTLYYYVIADGSRQVCYLDKQPELSALNIRKISVKIKNSLIDLICYPFDPNYFETP
jgi:hypothetical protein